MKCGYSKEILALYIEDDLPTPEAMSMVESHVAGCRDCSRYCDELRKSQSFIKSRFRPVHPESVSQDMLAGMRRAVMSQIEPVRQSLGWAVRLERFLVLGLRRPHYAAIGFAFVAIVSASLLGQIRQASSKGEQPAAVFAANNALVCPTDYREWVSVGNCVGHKHVMNESSEVSHNIYINPAAHREYTRSGKRPQGTVMVLETVQGSDEREVRGLAVSVKDSSRFEEGWGFYDFTGNSGQLKREAEALPQSAGCLSCHRDKSATDHVFTKL